MWQSMDTGTKKDYYFTSNAISEIINGSFTWQQTAPTLASNDVVDVEDDDDDVEEVVAMDLPPVPGLVPAPVFGDRPEEEEEDSAAATAGDANEEEKGLEETVPIVSFEAYRSQRLGHYKDVLLKEDSPMLDKQILQDWKTLKESEKQKWVEKNKAAAEKHKLESTEVYGFTPFGLFAKDRKIFYLQNERRLSILCSSLFSETIEEEWRNKSEEEKITPWQVFAKEMRVKQLLKKDEEEGSEVESIEVMWANMTGKE